LCCTQGSASNISGKSPVDQDPWLAKRFAKRQLELCSLALNLRFSLISSEFELWEGQLLVRSKAGGRVYTKCVDATLLLSLNEQ
jgi:hypothetical protein